MTACCRGAWGSRQVTSYTPEVTSGRGQPRLPRPPLAGVVKALLTRPVPSPLGRQHRRAHVQPGAGGRRRGAPGVAALTQQQHLLLAVSNRPELEQLPQHRVRQLRVLLHKLQEGLAFKMCVCVCVCVCTRACVYV
jgi:hypothetical protein